MPSLSIANKKFILFVFLGVVVVAGIVFLFIRRPEAPKAPLAAASIAALKKDIVLSLSATGIIVPPQTTNLAFGKDGKVTKIFVREGDQVKSGDILANIENSLLLKLRDAAKKQFQAKLAELQSAQEKFSIEEGKFKKLVAGYSSESFDIAKLDIQSAQKMISKAKEDTVRNLKNVYLEISQAISFLDTIFVDQTKSSIGLKFISEDQESVSQALFARSKLNITLIVWKDSLEDLTVKGDLAASAREARSVFEEIKELALNTEAALDAIGDPNIPAASISLWRTIILQTQRKIQEAETSLLRAEEKVVVSNISLKEAKENLASLFFGPTAQKIKDQESVLTRAGQNVSDKTIIANDAFDKFSAAENEFLKTIIISPTSGYVSKLSISKGDGVLANLLAISIIADPKASFEVKAFFDDEKIKPGHLAEVKIKTLDGEKIFPAEVYFIDRDNVLLKFTEIPEPDTRFLIANRSVDVKIIIAKKESVIVIPESAVLEKSYGPIVRVLKGWGNQEVKVKLGLRDFDGHVEITEGLKEGDKILLNPY